MALDINGDGVITLDELHVLLKSLKSKLRMSEREIKRFEAEFDKDGDGTIDFVEFMIATDMTYSGTPEEKLRWAFKV